MLNEITTSSALEGDGYTTSDFRTEDQWLGEALNHSCKRQELVRLAYVNKFGFSQAKLAKLIGCGASTVKDDIYKLLATGELTEEHYQKKMCNSRKPKQTERNPLEPVENSTPTYVTPVTTEPLSPIHDLRTEPEPVLASVTVVDDTAERDYEQALEHIDAIIALTKKYFHTGWDSRKWYELAGECRTIEACCTNHCGSNFGAGSQRSCG